jgi:predicted amidohydrolase YtcJ
MDAHVHMMAGAAQLEQIALNDAKTIDDFQKMTKEYATAHPDKKWIQGMGWYYSVFGKNGVPDKKFIDKVVPTVPFIWRRTTGMVPCGSKALQIAESPGKLSIRLMEYRAQSGNGRTNRLLKKSRSSLYEKRSTADSRGGAGSHDKSHPLRQFSGSHPLDQRRCGCGAC